MEEKKIESKPKGAPDAEQIEDIEQQFEIWENLMKKLFSISLVDKLVQLHQLPKEAKERIAYLYESQIGNAYNGFKRRLKAIAGKYQLTKIFADAHEVLNFTLLIAELSKMNTGFAEEELYDMM